VSDESRDLNSAINKATFVHDQVGALIHEMSIRVPDALMHCAGLINSKELPPLKPGEWEIIRKLAMFGWAHYSLSQLELKEGTP
jgi:hypothetical protein